MAQEEFRTKIINVLEDYFPDKGSTIFELSPIISYISIKTKSANRGSKSRGSFANLYAIYVLVEDYINQGHLESGNYSEYEGADFSPLLKRMRELPFGSKLQNHALNSRLNDEYHKYFPDDDRRPIIRNVNSQKYWITESLLKIKVTRIEHNLAEAIIAIIHLYIDTKQESFTQFIDNCEQLKIINEKDSSEVVGFILSLLKPESDARVFEIASYAILKACFANEVVFIGLTADSVQKEILHLYKTGRTNANDGGIDFVMKPLGRFFQVTETLDVKKYFLDIDKIEKFPITFVIKTDLSIDEIMTLLEEGAKEQYCVNEVVKKYMSCIEDIYNIPKLTEFFHQLVKRNKVSEVLDEIIKWSKVEFNLDSEQTINIDSVADDDEED